MQIACCFLYRSTRAGSANPPLFTGRKRMEVFEDLAKPAHFFRALVTRGCSSWSSHVMGRSSTSKGHDILGQTPNLKASICCQSSVEQEEGLTTHQRRLLLTSQSTTTAAVWKILEGHDSGPGKTERGSDECSHRH